ncbi:MAG: hypothetical protein ACPGNV_11720 [Mangrovicoccus sp.]
MELTSSFDAPYPQSQTYAALADFDALTASLTPRGFEVTQTAEGDTDGVGKAWKIAFGFRGVHREIAVEVIEATPETGFVLRGNSEGLVVTMSIALAGLENGRCRVSVVAEAAAETFTARLLLQSLRLARAKIQPKFDSRVAAFLASRLAEAASPQGARA